MLCKIISYFLECLKLLETYWYTHMKIMLIYMIEAVYLENVSTMWQWRLCRRTIVRKTITGLRECIYKTVINEISLKLQCLRFARYKERSKKSEKFSWCREFIYWLWDVIVTHTNEEIPKSVYRVHIHISLELLG